MKPSSGTSSNNLGQKNTSYSTTTLPQKHLENLLLHLYFYDENSLFTLEP